MKIIAKLLILLAIILRTLVCNTALAADDTGYFQNRWKPSVPLSVNNNSAYKLEVVGDGYLRIKEKLTTNYLNIEYGNLQSSPIQSYWFSAQWKPILVDSAYYKLQNKWKPDQYIHIENGAAQSGTIQSGWLSAQWKFVLESPQSYALSVSKSGTGSGTVSSSPAGIDCGNTCSANYTANSTVTLTASPASGSTFTGWGGACSGTGTCSVTMSAAKSVTATFASAATDGMKLNIENPLDGASFNGGESFTKTWTLQNTGTTTWNNLYCLDAVSGSNTTLGSGKVCVNGTVAPGQTYTFSVAMKAPAAQSSETAYTQYWRLTNSSGIRVGTFDVWVAIKVKASTSAQSIFGIDVSYANGNVNWVSVKNTGIKFAFIKSSEGFPDASWPESKAKDPTFRTNMDNALSQGIMTAPYHFARPDYNAGVDGAKKEAEAFLSNVKSYYLSNDKKLLPPVIDIEYSTGSLTDWVIAFIDLLKQEINIDPIIYANESYANNYLDSRLARYPLWVAKYPLPNDGSYPPSAMPSLRNWSGWTFWQFTDKGTISGSGNAFDKNVFNGDQTKLTSMLVSSSVVQNPNTTITPLVSGQSTIGYITQGAWKYYSITSASGSSTNTIELTGLSSDANLYVRKGSIPTASAYDCRPYNSGTNNESCSIPLSSSSTIYIGINSNGSTNYNLKATTSSVPVTDDHGNTTSSATSLVLNGAYTNGNIGVAGDIDFFKVTLGSAGTLTADIAGSVDTYAQLYDTSGLKIGTAKSGTNYTISSSVSSSGTYYLSIRHNNLTGTGAYQVKTWFSLPAPTLKLPATGTTVSQTGNTTFTWNTVPGATKYRIVISPYQDFRDFNESAGDNGCSTTGTCLTIPNASNPTLTGTSFLKNGFGQSGTTYYWKVRAANNDGASTWSNTWSIKTSGSASTACGGKPYMDLPFSSSIGHKEVTQGNNGSTSHYNHGTWDNTYAIDLALPLDTDLKAPTDGYITAVYGKNGTGCLGGGQVIVFKDKVTGKNITFLHLSRIDKDASSTTLITKGTIIGRTGKSYTRSCLNTADVHLHFHLWNGYRDPDAHTETFSIDFQLRVQELQSNGTYVEKCLYGSALNDSLIGRGRSSGRGLYWKSMLP